MEPTEFRKLIVFHPNIRFGKPSIVGTRITVSDILSWIGSGISREEILADFPELKEEHILAAFTFGSKKANIVKTIKV